MSQNQVFRMNRVFLKCYIFILAKTCHKFYFCSLLKVSQELAKTNKKLEIQAKVRSTGMILKITFSFMIRSCMCCGAVL